MVLRHSAFVIAVLLAVLMPAGVSAAAQTPANSPEANRVEQIIMIIIDGLGERSLEKTLTPNSFLLGQSGIKVQDVNPALPDRTGPAVATILTGLEPARHGYIDSEDKLRGDSLFTIAEAQGYKTAFFDGTGGSLEALGKNCSFQFKDNFQGKDRQVMDLAIEELGKRKIYLSVIILPQLRAILEQYGAESKEFTEAVADSDNQVGRLIHFLHQNGKFEKTLLVLTGTSGEPPLLFNGPGVKNGNVISSAGLVDIAPTVDKLVGLQGGPCSGLVLWDGFRPSGEQSESYLLAQRVNNLGRAYNEARREINRTQEEKIAIEKGQSRLASEKNLILKEIGRRDIQIERLQIKMRIMKYAGFILLAALLLGYLYQYRYLKKKFLLFH